MAKKRSEMTPDERNDLRLKARLYKAYIKEHEPEKYKKQMKSNRAYRNTPEGKAEYWKVQKAYRELNKEKERAYRAYYLSIPGNREKCNAVRRERRKLTKLREQQENLKHLEDNRTVL